MRHIYNKKHLHIDRFALHFSIDVNIKVFPVGFQFLNYVSIPGDCCLRNERQLDNISFSVGSKQLGEASLEIWQPTQTEW